MPSSLTLHVPGSGSGGNRLDNKVITSKYTKWTFLPKVLVMQFKRGPNLFYLVAVMLMFASEVTNGKLFLSPYTSIGTLSILTLLVGATVVFEARDDLRRHRDDRRTNRLPTTMLRHRNKPAGTSARTKANWGQLRAGDVIEIKNREQVPADVLVLQTSTPNGRCYIETSGIDGETNLKIKQVATGMHALVNGTKNWDTALNGQFEYDTPSALLQFTGTFTPADASQSKASLDMNGVILRGSELRNTDSIVAMVLYAGHETKLVLSKKNTPTKYSLIDKSINRLMLVSGVAYIIMVVTLAVQLVYVQEDTDELSYFAYTSSIGGFYVPGIVAYLLTFAILFTNLIPINLTVCLEATNIVHAYWFRADVGMYDFETDTPADARTSSLMAEIGQITHIFSDKTGTLTRNVMRLVGCSVGGHIYGYVPGRGEFKESESDDEDDGDDGYEIRASRADSRAFANEDMEQPKVNTKSADESQVPTRELFRDMISQLKSGESKRNSSNKKKKDELVRFLTLVALCHTVVIDHDEDGNVRYNAEGPDEEALVSAVAELGVKCIKSENNKLTVVSEWEGKANTELVFDVLAVNTFNSDRKRMSVLVRDASGTITLLVKGADNVILSRLKDAEKQGVALTNNHLDRFSRAGLRTLVMAERVVSEDEYTKWKSSFEAASTTSGEARGEALAVVADDIEHSLTLVGSSAIEDELQEGVPETIKMIRSAGITLWVLTGDKMQTAINIAFSAELMDSSMFLMKLEGSDTQVLMDNMDKTLSILEKAAKEEQQDTRNRLSNTKAGPGATDGRMSAKHSSSGALANEVRQRASMGLEAQRSSVRMRSMTNLGDEQGGQFVADGLALVVSGEALENLITAQNGTPESEARLLRLLQSCNVVLACRVSPKQKALIVRLVANAPSRRKGEKAPVSLSIGDGANDVPMIQEARVGVGISGKEGLQAVNNSDFSIAQFKFLQRMLFVHGRWNYRRAAKLTKFITYSWQVLAYPLLLFLFYSLLSAQQVYYQTYYVSIFPWVSNFTMMMIAFMDRDMSEESALRQPYSYVNGRLGLDMNIWELVRTCVRAAVHGCIIFAGIFYTQDYTMELSTLGAAMFACLWAVMMLRQVQITHTYTHQVIVVYVVNVIVFVMLTVAVDIVLGYDYTVLMFDTGFTVTWLPTILVVAAIAVLEATIKYLNTAFRPDSLQIAVEIDRGYVNGKLVSRSSTLDAMDVLTDASRSLVFGPFLVPARAVRKAMKKAMRGSSANKNGIVALKTRSGYTDAGPTSLKTENPKHTASDEDTSDLRVSVQGVEKPRVSI